MSILDSIFGGGSTTTTNTSTLDPQTLAFLQQYRQRAGQAVDQAGKPNQYLQQGMGLFGAGLDPAMQMYQQMAGAGNAAMTPFGAHSLDAYMDPYMNSVIGGVHNTFDRQRGLATAAASDAATKAGAFGGSRSAVLQALGTHDVNQNESNTVAGLMSSGYTGAMNAYQTDQATSASIVGVPVRNVTITKLPTPPCSRTASRRTPRASR